MDGARGDAVAGLGDGAGQRLGRQAEAAVDERGARQRPGRRRCSGPRRVDLAGARRAAAGVRRSMRTPAWARRTLAGARSPVRASSLPAMLSWVTSTARPPSSSARATPIGPPIGSNTTMSPSAGSAAAPRRRSATSTTTAPSATSYSRRRGPSPCTARRPSPAGHVRRCRCARRRRAGRPRRPATRRAAPFGPADRRPARRARRPARRARRGGRGSPATRAASSPAGPPPTTATSRGARAGAYQSGSSVSRPDVGSPMHVTIGLRASRTWHVWLHRVHGRIRSGCAGAQLGDEVGIGDLGPGHLDRRARGRVVVAADRPLRLADVDDRALQRRPARRRRRRPPRRARR